MRLVRSTAVWLALTMGGGLVHGPAAFGQAAANSSPAVVASPAPPQNRSLPPQPTRSPVESFRELLLMPAGEQESYLAVRPPEIRKKILEKVMEYHALPPEEREWRLKATELRWYLQPLLPLPATNRAAQLSLVPVGMRELVEVRLEQWDRLPPAVQQVLLTNQQAVGLITGVDTGPAAPPSPGESVRRKLFASFYQLFELTPEEKARASRTLSEAERRQMENTLRSFEELPPEKRERCIQAFSKFAALGATERQEFLKNAERWSQMTPTERQAWRELVSVAPILPSLPPRPRPPLPHASSRSLPAPVATNGQ